MLFVEATPISGPANVKIVSSDNLAILLSETFTIEKVLLLIFLLLLKAGNCISSFS